MKRLKAPMRIVLFNWFLINVKWPWYDFIGEIKYKLGLSSNDGSGLR